MLDWLGIYLISGCSETAIILDLGSSVPSSNLGTPTRPKVFWGAANHDLRRDSKNGAGT